jgi:class 3 adenylate cyclase
VEGFEAVYALQGGLDAWLQAGYPIVVVRTGVPPVRAAEHGEAAAALPLSASTPAVPGAPVVLPLSAHAHTFLAGLAQHYMAEPRVPARKELAVLFVDIADSTAMVLHQPPEVALALVQRFMGMVTEIALAHCGDVKDYEGDGALLYFESVPEATHAAMAIRSALTHAQPAGQAPLRARLSLNVGSIIVGVIGSALRRSVALIGPSIHIAARLLKHIPPGGIIATEAVVERLREEAPAIAQRFEVWDPCLVLKGVEDECVSAFHLP